jgi:CheY-like chemotaxis protein
MKTRVLIVDDEKEFVELVSERLTSCAWATCFMRSLNLF